GPYGYYAPYPYYYAPTPALAGPPAYYCPATRAYYPQVADCPGGWEPVIPPTMTPSPIFLSLSRPWLPNPKAPTRSRSIRPRCTWKKCSPIAAWAPSAA